MKTPMLILALLTVATTSAIAGRSEASTKSEGFYTHARRDDAATARAQAFSSSRSSLNVYNAAGKIIGADPDANVRLQLRRNYNVN